MSYHVKVVREGDAWVADVVDLAGAHTFARNLSSLDANVREAIAAIEDMPEGAEDTLLVEYEYANVSDYFVQAVRIGERRAEVDAEHERLQTQAAALALSLVEEGSSVRDIAAILRMSPGRVSQITTRFEQTSLDDIPGFVKPHAFHGGVFVEVVDVGEDDRVVVSTRDGSSRVTKKH